MRELFLDFVVAIALLCGLVLAVDAAPRVLASLRRRRAARGGAFGVVVDRAGRVLGTYLDPFGHPWRTPREHGPESPWLAADAEGQVMAWEGFGATREDALRAANRFRRRRLQLLSWLEDDEQDEPDWAISERRNRPD
jgi:hypothetical protein